MSVIDGRNGALGLIKKDNLTEKCRQTWFVYDSQGVVDDHSVVDVGKCGVEDNPRLNPQETLSPRHLGLQIIRYSAPIFNIAYKHVVNMLQITRYSALIINSALSTYYIIVQIILSRFSFSLPQ